MVYAFGRIKIVSGSNIRILNEVIKIRGELTNGFILKGMKIINELQENDYVRVHGIVSSGVLQCDYCEVMKFVDMDLIRRIFDFENFKQNSSKKFFDLEKF